MADRPALVPPDKINGNGTSPNVEGMVDQLTDPTDPTAVANFGNPADWAATLQRPRSR